MPERTFYLIKKYPFGNKLNKVGMKNSTTEKIEKIPKLKGILASKLKKITKTQVFGKSTCVHAPPDCE